MNTFKAKLKNFLIEEEGLTSVEYAVAGGVVAATVVAAFQALGGQICSVIDTIITTIGGTATACGATS